MKISLASDHAGYELKEIIFKHLENNRYGVIDFGTKSKEVSVDYPHYAHCVSKSVAEHKTQMGILVCGTGIGMSMVANRDRDIRAAVCVNEYMAEMTRAHNNANVLCLGARIIKEGLAKSIVDVFCNTAFDQGRHQKRIDQF